MVRIKLQPTESAIRSSLRQRQSQPSATQLRSLKPLLRPITPSLNLIAIDHLIQNTSAFFGTDPRFIPEFADLNESPKLVSEIKVQGFEFASAGIWY
jgi:hypothetical protein